MTSILNVDTIADKAGTGPVGLTKQIAAKHYVTYNASQVVSDSFNNSSITDVGSGNHRFNFTNSFSVAAGYTAGGVMAHSGDNDEYTYSIQPKSSPDIATSSLEVVTIFVNRSVEGIQDYTYNCSTSHGDLA
jgi:hypothetical protein